MMNKRIAAILKGLGFGVLILVLLMGLAAVDFARRMASTFDPGRAPGLGVVFTGQFVRTYAGLELLEDGEIDRLLISGVNMVAGMPAQNFVQQFNLSPKLIHALDDGRLALGEKGENTLENALETRCWLAHVHSERPIVLITSSWHLPRASVVLERTLRHHKVERYGVSDGLMSRDVIVDEFFKYLAESAISFWWLISGTPKFEC